MEDKTKETASATVVPKKGKISFKGVLTFIVVFLLGCVFTAILGGGVWAINKYILNPTSGETNDECEECEECDECDEEGCPVCEECEEPEDRTDTLSISYLDERLYITYPIAYRSDISYSWSDYGGGEGLFELNIDGATFSISWYDPMGWESFGYPDLSVVEFEELTHNSGDTFIRIRGERDYEGNHSYAYTTMREGDRCRDIFSEPTDDFTGIQCGFGPFSDVGDIDGLLFVSLTIPEGYSESRINGILDVADEIVAGLDMY
ncbi:hypothetical protein JW962_02545 [Candidatus Dojkabacteria bacterium]|nr:hypothetical protein [Candidatus Dojkabacteria bacterium]